MRVIIASVTSDIGTQLAGHWLDIGWEVAGTYRTESKQLTELVERGLQKIEVDFTSHADIEAAIGKAKKYFKGWDVIVMCPASMNPIGSFESCDFKDWAASVEMNFLSTMKFIHCLLPLRERKSNSLPTIITWAGGGVNSAPVNYSAYTVSKISQLKMMELLDAEIDDAKFVMIGPGWVDTKIHQETLRSGSGAGENLKKTLSTIDSGNWTPMSAVINCCDWVIKEPRHVVGGRNFSVVNDEWQDEALSRRLERNSEIFKLRRYGNDG